MTDAEKRVGPWRIERTLARDLCGLYHAVRRDNGERATLYVLASEFGAAEPAPLARLVGLHQELSHAGLVRFRSLAQDAGERYLVADAVDDAMAPLRSRNRPGPGQVRVLGAALADALGHGHERGVVHGGLDLDNALWAPGRAPQVLGAGVAAVLGDCGALAQGDVAALGRLLCALIIGHQSLGDDGAVGDGRIFELVRMLADPTAAISMRQAHARLAGPPPRPGQAVATAADRVPPDDPVETRTSSGTAPGRYDHPDAGRHTAAAADSAEPGERLARYRILTRLGRGGMGEVFLAEDPALRRGVALKRIRPALRRDRVVQARLRREAQLAARLNHRAIVQIFDLIVADTADYLVMEYVPGPSLHALVGDAAMPVPEAVRIAAEVADGLACAHQHGIVHRDIKLENVLIGPDRQPKLTDFGIARRAALTHDSTAPESLTRERSLIGTLRAMSPEQIHGQEVDARSDLFSFGVMLYELVTGVTPFASGSALATIPRVLQHRQAPAHEVAPGVPRALSELIDQLLEKSAARRPGDAGTVRDRLRDLDLRAATSAAPADPWSIATLTSGRSSLGAPVAVGERRQVTLVCVELVGGGGPGAAPGAAIDAELLAAVLPEFRARVDDILAGVDGVVIGALGPRLIMCVGHPRPIEDAARRAVLAARAIIDAAAAPRVLDPAHREVRVAARAALHTGLAVTGSDGALVLGATLDAALRLLADARAGDLWLSGATARLVESEFQLDDPGGLAAETSARRVLGTATPGATGSGEHDRPMVGRDHEMQLLLGAWRRARDGQGQIALLTGEPGIGKSRLTRALAAAIVGDRPHQIVLRGSAHRQRSALEPVAEAITALLAATGSGEPGDDGAARERLAGLTGLDEIEQVLHLLGRPSHRPAAPERGRHQLLRGLRDVLIGANRDAPTLLVVEDLHWLDPSTLDLLALIIESAAAWPVFLVMTTRPGLRPPWPATAAITQLRLGRLEPAAIDAVIAHACAERALRDDERALRDDERAMIVARCEGVPLYAEELVRAALELGRAGEIPSTLRDALAARLHQLGPAATRVAHIAAVAGREFTADLIAAAGGFDRAAVDRELERLVAVEILFRRRRGRGREPLYQFGHVLLQQAAYDELLATDRRHLHGDLADALLADERAGGDPGPELIAHHLAAARRFDEAIASARRGALRALARHARVEGRELLRQAVSWLDQLPESDARDRIEIDLRMQLDAVLLTTEGYTSPELEQSCRRTEILCERHADMPLPVKYSLWAVRVMSGGSGGVEPMVGWFEQVIARGSPPVERMMAHVSLGIHDCVRASYDQARHHLEHAMALFVPAEHPDVLQRYGGCGGFYSHVFTTMLMWNTGRFADAWRHGRSTVALAEALDPYSFGCALTTEMMLHIAVGDVARAEPSAERVHELATRHELPFLACMALCGRGWAAARLGRAERAIADLAMGTGRLKQIGIKVWSPYCLSLAADSALALGQLDRADRAIADALEVCRTSVDRGHEPELLRLRGRLILARDASARSAARAAFGDALAIARRNGGRALALRAATDLAALLRDDRLPHDALAVLAPEYRGLAADVDEPNLAPARALLAELAPGAALA